MFIKKICVVGLGYIGLPTSAILATKGFNVVGVDISKDKVDQIKNCKLSINEAGLGALLKKAMNSKNLTVQTDIPEADVFIVCVPTPLNKNKKAELSFVENAVKSVGKKLRRGNLVILESTVPPGTTKGLVRKILENESKLKCPGYFYLTYSPERVLPGNLLKELVKNNRVIGGIDVDSAKKAEDVYSSFVEGEVCLTDTVTAEFVKLMENTYRAVNIALANEFAKIGKHDINIREAIEIANKHPRVNILNPGPGVGGHCIPLDPWFLVDENSKLIKIALETNKGMPGYVCKLLENVFKKAKKKIKNSKIVLLGASYKKDVDDIRESPTNKLVNILRGKECNVVVYDPIVEHCRHLEKNFKKAFKNADACVIVTDHSVFKNIDWNKVKKLMNNNPVLIDTRNIVKDVKGFISEGY
ncbi:MAG: nucleotide sugar dehydrogenase [Nanoarchaeota archaeon]|nr:nucleotide sugar dehydrogenase [Nanoarchaeota archaeon]